MIPYFDDGKGRVIYHGDCREILLTLPKCDLVLTDPPYSEKTHKGARTWHESMGINGGEVAVTFDSVDVAFVRSVFSKCCPRRWLISFLDWRHALPLEQEPPNGLEFIRLGVWSKLNPMPQLTGDRPSTGWEAIVIMHPPGKKQWNGGSEPALWMHGTSRFGYFGPSCHPTEKPIGLVQKLVRQFSEKDNTVLDPFMGSGTTLRACKDLGLSCIGIELEEKYCEIAARRLRQECFEFEGAA